VLVPLLLLGAAAPAVAAREPLPVRTHVDYQLGGVRAVPASVGIVVRDRTARPASGRYNVCYVNGFQTQPDERRFWQHRPRLVLRNNGRPVVDSAWGEWLLDRRRVGYDFAVAEECGRYRACAAYVAHFGRRVLAIEYRRVDFRWTCARYGSRLSVVLRDRSLSPRGVRQFC